MADIQQAIHRISQVVQTLAATDNAIEAREEKSNTQIQNAISDSGVESQSVEAVTEVSDLCADIVAYAKTADHEQWKKLRHICDLIDHKPAQVVFTKLAKLVRQSDDLKMIWLLMNNPLVNKLCVVYVQHLLTLLTELRVDLDARVRLQDEKNELQLELQKARDREEANRLQEEKKRKALDVLSKETTARRMKTRAHP